MSSSETNSKRAPRNVRLRERKKPKLFEFKQGDYIAALLGQRQLYNHISDERKAMILKYYSQNEDQLKLEFTRIDCVHPNYMMMLDACVDRTTVGE